MSAVDQNFFKEIELVPRVSPEFELTLDNTPVVHAIQTMNFFQMKGEIVFMFFYYLFICCHFNREHLDLPLSINLSYIHTIPYHTIPYT